MGTTALAEEQPTKRRRKSKYQSAVPKWETTRAFAEPKSLTKYLPTVTEDGAVHRASSSGPKFFVRAEKRKGPSLKSDETSNSLELQAYLDESSLRKAKPFKEVANASFKVTRKRQRRELEQYAKKIEDFESTKASIAGIATKIVSNPEEKVALFKQLRQMAQQHKGRSAALVILTEAQLYVDIAPAYKIRSITEKEAETKVSKDVARIRNFEEALLANYQRFVKSCISMSRWRSGGANETAGMKNMRIVRLAACKALAELSSALPHFNEANTVATAVCGLVMDREEEVRRLSTKALKVVLEGAHRASGETLDVCVLIAKNLANSASGKQRAAPEEVLAPLVSIQFANFPLLPPSSKKRNEPKKSKRFIKKRRRKRRDGADAEETELEKDLREADAKATPQELYTAKKSLLDAVCHAYFNIIQAATNDETSGAVAKKGKRERVKKPPPALSAALKGLMRVSTFVSTAVLEAILGALTPLLAERRLPLGIRFRCISAAYAILGRNSSTQKTDSSSFTGDARALDSALYSAVGCLYGPNSPSKDDEYVTFDVVETVMAAMNRREIPTARCAALARRLSILSANAAPTHGCTIGLLLAAQQLMSPSLVSPAYVQKAQENENRFGGDVGTVQELDMDIDDPDIASAERSAAWELACLACHFHPSASDLAEKSATGGCGSQLLKAAENIMMLAKKHKSAEGGFNPSPVATWVANNGVKMSRKTTLLQDRVLIEALPEAADREIFLKDSGEELPDNPATLSMEPQIMMT